MEQQSHDTSSSGNNNNPSDTTKPPKKISTIEDVAKLIKESKPPIRNRFDAVTLVLHLIMKDLHNFRCVGTTDQIDSAANEKLVPEGWNKSSDAYSFYYKQSQSSMTFVIKNLIMGDKLLVNGLAIEDNRVYTLELNVKDYIKDGVASDDFENMFMNLQALHNLFKQEIVSKLLPMTESEADRPTRTSSTSSSTNRTPQPSSEGYDPLRVGPPRYPRMPVSPLYEPGPSLVDPPFGIGAQDLYPSGPGMFPGGVPGFFPGGGGNLIGPNHPGFGPRVTDPYSGGFGPFGGGRGRGRGGAPPGHPPGARFDPYGPPGFGFEPDNDELPPPGFNNSMI